MIFLKKNSRLLVTMVSALFLIFLCNISYGQTGSKQDAIALLEKAKENENNLEQAVKYAEEAVVIAGKGEYSQVKVDALSFIASLYKSKRKFATALDYYLQALQEVETLGDKEQAKVYYGMGYLYEAWGVHEKSIDYFKKIYELEKKVGNIDGQIDAKKLMGIAYLHIPDYRSALENYTILVELNKKQNNANGVIASLRKVADTYINLNNYEKALDYNLEILDLKNEQKDSLGISNYYNEIGFIYKHLNKYKQALKYFQKAVALNKQLNKNDGENSLILINIGVMHQYLKDVNSALASFNEVLEVEKAQNDNLEIARVNTYIVAIYLGLQDYNNAKDYAKEAIKYAKIADNKTLLEKNYKRLSEIFERSGNARKALLYYKKYADVKDLLIQEEKKKQQVLRLNQVEAEKKEKDLKLLLVEQEVKNLALQKLQIKAEKKEQELSLLQKDRKLGEQNKALEIAKLNSDKLEKERSLLAKTKKLQVLMIAQQKLEADAKNQEMASMQMDREMADLIIQKGKAEAERVEKERVAKEEIALLKEQDAKQQQLYFIIAMIAAAIIIILIVASLVGMRKSNRKLALQNQEIQEQNWEIAKQKDEIVAQKEEVEKAYQNIQILSEFGQKISSTLDVETINKLVYEYVITLMDATSFGIGLIEEKTEAIEFKGFIDEGEVMPYTYDLLSEDNSLSVWCVKNQKPIVINDFLADVINYVADETNYLTKDTPGSIIYLPLIKKNKPIGVITVQSKSKNAYSQKDLTILQTLASYITISLDNAHAYEVIKDRNKHITDSIRYAQTIQEAILPSPNKISEILPEHFILFRPKDIVSGDYYWYSHIPSDKLGEGAGEAGKTFIAAIDCTGHGVPGAFMSMIGNTLLNEIVNQKDIYDPAEIIELLNTGIIKALRQDEKANDDGMDICLCMIEDYPTGEVKVTFAGAKRPLYYIVEGQSTLRELKGDNKTIGGIQRKEKDFKNQEVILPKGSMVYLSTDGWVDQNNLNRKKLGTLKFKKLLQNNAHLQLKSQRQALETALDIHKRDVEQRDDITILGVRV